MTSTPRKILRKPALCDKVQLSPVQVWRKANDPDDDFPAPVLLGPNAIGWFEDEIAGGPEPEKVSTEATGYAAHLIDEYFKPMAVRVYGDAALPEDEAHAIAIARRIRKERHQTINVRQIRRTWCLPGLKAPEKIMAAIRVLEEGGWTRPAPSRQGQTPGRQSSDYDINPRVLETRE